MSSLKTTMYLATRTTPSAPTPCAYRTGVACLAGLTGAMFVLLAALSAG